ncbi:hypothetical protein [Pontiella agarivorans]|uniref:Uncharacterized protein n=1 Tax=Pontiella agarivorans TaxID=3038953 RepID=A0ABU5MX02_9BACT|nr:hypothetical protein [Pontiella agarivorans]MDZ8118749.1 hypothetical protein [Pontiella agarivorans]
MKWWILSVGLVFTPAVWAGSVFVDFEKQLIFPQELAGMSCAAFAKYENDNLGYSVMYTNGSFRCGVSLLNMGRSEIPDGYRGEGVDMMFEAVETDLQRREEEGRISNVRNRGGTVVPKKSPLQFANNVFQYLENRDSGAGQEAVPCIQSVYITGSHNHFVKMTFSFDVAENQQARMIADRLLKELVLLLIAEPSEKELLLAACDAAVYDPAGYSGQTAAQRVYAKIQNMDGLSFYDAFFVWPQERYRKPKNADFLTTAYFAGMLRAVLPEDLESGGEVEAFEAMLEAYENMRARDQITEIPQLEEWIKAGDRRALYQKLLVEFGYAVAE